MGRGACSQVLDDASIRQLGVGAACVWRDARQLVAYLSPDYSLRPDSEISIRPFALRGFLENDDYASGSIQVGISCRSSVSSAVVHYVYLSEGDARMIDALCRIRFP